LGFARYADLGSSAGLRRWRRGDRSASIPCPSIISHVDGLVTTGREQLYPSAGVAAWGLSVLMFAAVISFLDRQLVALLVEPIKHHFDLTDIQISLLQGLAFSFLYAVAGYWFGRLADQSNRRNLIVYGILVWSFATIACGLAGNFTQFFIARVGVGVGEAVLFPAAYSLIGDLFPPHRRARAFSLFAAAGTAGAALSFLLGGELFAAVQSGGLSQLGSMTGRSGWQLVFIAAGLPGFLATLLILGLKEPARQERGKAAIDGGPPLTTFIASNIRALAIVFVSFGLCIFGGYGILAWMAAAYGRVYHLDPPTAGKIAGVIVLTSGLGGIVIGSVLGGDRFTRHFIGGKLLVVCVSGVIATLILSLWWLIDDVPESIAIGAVGCAFAFSIGGLAPAALNDIVPNELRGRLSALYLLMTAIFGYACGPFAVAWMTEHLFVGPDGIRKALTLLSCAFTLAALTAWFGRGIYGRARLAQLSATRRLPIAARNIT